MFGGGPAPEETHGEYVEQLRARLEEAYKTVREHTRGVQKYEKQFYDRKATGGRYCIGDLVWLYTPAVPRGRAAKFHRPWRGPYRVVKVLSDITYRIQLVSLPQRQDRRCRHRLVVHFNRLKPCRSHPFKQPTVLPTSPDHIHPTAASSLDEGEDMDEWTPLNDNCASPQQPVESSIEPSHPSSGEKAGDTEQTEFMREESDAAGSGEDSNTEQTELIHEESAGVGSAEHPDVEQTGMTFQGPTRGGPIWGYRLRSHIRPPNYYQPGTGNA